MATTQSVATQHHQIHARLQLQRPGFRLDIDMNLPGRGVTALFGPSGCGKTTCLRAIAGLTRAKGSHVSVNGEVWQDDAQQIWRPTHERALGYVFQEASLFDHLNVRRNLEYGLQRTPCVRRKVALEQAIELLGIGHLMDRTPEALSGGERQRVAMARALATSPQVLLMDEPLAALDAQRKAEVLPYLERLHQALDIPVLYVSHAIDEVARLAHHMVLLEHGQVIAQGATQELLGRLDLARGQADMVATVMDGTVLCYDRDDCIATVAFAGGQWLLPVATSLPDGARIRLRIQACDVSLALQAPQHSSILNIVPAVVVQLRDDSPGQVMVTMDIGNTRLLARVTQRSAHALGLQAGLAVLAQVKAISIVG